MGFILLFLIHLTLDMVALLHESTFKYASG
jgi:hypothetical protein